MTLHEERTRKLDELQAERLALINKRGEIEGILHELKARGMMEDGGKSVRDHKHALTLVQNDITAINMEIKQLHGPGATFSSNLTNNLRERAKASDGLKREILNEIADAVEQSALTKEQRASAQ